MSTSYIIPFTAFILVQFHIFLYLVFLPSPYCSAFAFHFTSSMQCRIWYPMSDAARKAIELSREVCGCDSPLSTVEGPTSKPLFIPQPTVVRQPKCQWVRSYLQACFLCPLSSWGNRARKEVLCVRTERGFSRLGRKSLLWQWFLKRTNWTSPLFFPLPPLLLLFFFSFLFSSAQTGFLWQPSPVPLGLANLLLAAFFYLQNYTPYVLSLCFQPNLIATSDLFVCTCTGTDAMYGHHLYIITVLTNRRGSSPLLL